MEDIPKILRERLAATPRPGVHPDPDLLAAFAENALSDRERGAVLDHLGHCSECREVVALAEPQVELETVAAAVAASAPRRLPWLRSPIFRWGALAASLMIAGSAVLVYREAKERTAALVAARQSAPVVAKLEPAEKQSPPPAIAPGAANEQRAEKLATPTGAAGAGRAARAPVNRDLSASMAKKPSPADETQQASALRGELGTGPLPPPPAAANSPLAGAELQTNNSSGASSPRKELAQAPASLPATASQKTGSVSIASSAEAVELPASGGKPENLQKAKAVPQAHVSIGAFAGGNNLDLMRPASNAITPRWVLSSDGAMLLRSTDNGKTWRAIPVASHVIFLSLEAFGSQVWAGGGDGALYHSADAGEHWLQVKPIADGEALTGDVTQIHFTDTQHGELLTAHHQVWSTEDGGKTWRVK
jgi:Photosynthesis system II assembly factor YCF48/Putative zinc-finger